MYSRVYCKYLNIKELLDINLIIPKIVWFSYVIVANISVDLSELVYLLEKKNVALALNILGPSKMGVVL